MITASNRHHVTNILQHLQSAAHYFSAFSMVGAFPASEAADQVSKEMASWARIKADRFDEQFRELAAVLGYRFEKIAPEEPVASELQAAE
jgi:hypothetical protein